MGGRMGGESPREEKLAMRRCGTTTECPYQAKDEGVSGAASTVAQTSGQQPMVCDPLGQHGLRAVWQCISADVCRSGIDAATAA